MDVLDKISNGAPGRWMDSVSRTICAVLQGTVDFSTMIAPGFAAMAMSLVAPSSATMLVAAPAPIPEDFVGVLTLRKTMSAFDTHFDTRG